MRCISIILPLSLVITISSQECPDGWRASDITPNKCYYVGIQKKIWFDADAYCTNAAPNAHLTSITSAFENYNVDAVATSTLNASACDQFWIGGNDFNVNGQFAWADGSPWQYTNWAPGQPDLTQNCVSSSALKTRLWKTEDCGVENCFICEMYMGGSDNTSLPPTTLPSTATSTRTSVSPPTTTSTAAPTTMTDCKDWFNHGAHTDGIYSINPDGRGSFNVFCDMTTDGGGWTVFQRRIDNTTSFYDKLWNDYKVGFNNGLDKNSWLGNDNIHALSSKDPNVELLIDFWGDRDNTISGSGNPNGYWWEKHTNFYIDDEAHFYTLHLSSSFTGNATTSSNSGIYYSIGREFTTADANYEASPSCSCLQEQGGWWFKDGQCAYSPLNGKYVPSYYGDYFGFFWYTGSIFINPKQSRMMLRSLT